jgi:hypothetical protein
MEAVLTPAVVESVAPIAVVVVAGQEQYFT